MNPTSRRDFISALALATAGVCLGARAEAGEAKAPLAAGQPSATARGAALSRALHQVLDAPLVFDDPHAMRILAPVPASEMRNALDGSVTLRASIVARSRWAEDRLADAVKRGVRQYVNLGAGLDTFACRNPHAAKGLKVYEVDHPATQAAKRQQLARAGLPTKPGSVFVPVDFETQSLAAELRRAGFRFDRPAYFAMLGVTIYLTHDAVMSTMRVVASGARGTQVAFSYSVPEALLPEGARAARRRSVERMAALGEPWITFYEPGRLADELRAAGFRRAEDLTPEETNRRYFAGRTDGLRVAAGHLMLATV